MDLKWLLKSFNKRFLCVCCKPTESICGIFSGIFHLLLFSGCCVVFIVWSSNLGTVFQLTDTSIKKSGLVTITACIQSSFHLLKSSFNNHTELHYWLILWSAAPPACWVSLFVWVDLLAILWAHLACVWLGLCPVVFKFWFARNCQLEFKCCLPKHISSCFSNI